MTDFKNLWGSSKTVEQKNEFVQIPTGVYQCVLDKATVSKSAENTLVSLWFKIVSSDIYNQRLLFSNYTLTEKGIPFLKQALVKLGVGQNEVEALSSIDDLQMLLNKVQGHMCEVTAKLKHYVKKDGTQATTHTVFINSELSNFSSNVTMDQPPSIDEGESLPF